MKRTVEMHQGGYLQAKRASAPRRGPLLWTALMVFLTAGYFQNSRPGWNANSQLALTYAIVERGTLSIDAYHGKGKETETDDKAFYRGHYYCDKSPVTAFLGVPAFWVYSGVTRGMLGRPVSYRAARYWTTWWVEGLAAAALAVMTALLLLRRGVVPGRAALAGFLWFAATPFLAYSILFFSYLPACAFAMGGFLLVERLWSGEAGEAPEPRMPAAFHIFLAGFLLGLATWTLNTLGLVALALTVGILAAPAADWKIRLRRLAPWAVGGILGIAGQFIYSRAVFNSWASPYAFEANPLFREQMAKGLMGATRPRLLVAWLITFSPFQGLFLIFPLVAAALAGCLAAQRLPRRPGRLEPLLALGVLVALVVYNSAYYMWWGGCGYLPRHLIPTLVLLAAGLAPWLAARRRWPAWFLLALAVLGVAINLPAVAVNPQHPMTIPEDLLMQPESVEAWQRPIAELHHYFWNQQTRDGRVVGYADANWGTALGFRPSPVSLVPLLVLWAAGAALLIRDRQAWRRVE